MTPLTNREQWLVRLLPAILVAAVYGLHYERSGELRRKTAELDAARLAAVSPAAFEMQRRTLNDMTAQVEAVKAEGAELEAARNRLATGDRWKPAVTTEVFRQVTEMLWEHHLVNFREAQVSDGDNQYPTALQRVLQASAPAEKSVERPRFWRVEFVGTYGDVLRALDELTASGLPAVPLRISMSPMQGSAAEGPVVREAPASAAQPARTGAMLASLPPQGSTPVAPAPQSAEERQAPLRVWTLLLWL